MRKRQTLNVNDRRHLYSVYARCQRAAQDFESVRVVALNGLPGLSAQNRDHVRELIAWLEVAIAKMQTMGPPHDGPPDPRTAAERLKQCNDAERSIWVASLIHAALSVYAGGDSECMLRYTRTILGSGEHYRFEIDGTAIRVKKVPVLSLALVDNLIRQTKGWRDATDPVAYLAAQCYRMASREADDAAPLEFQNVDTREPETVIPLDEIAETDTPASEVTVERLYSWDALKDEARRRGDLELLAYIEGLEAATGQGLYWRDAHRVIRKQMGWNKFEAKKIWARFLRLRDQAAGYTARGHPAISDASRNVYFETLHEGAMGRERGTWTLKNAPRERD